MLTTVLLHVMETMVHGHSMNQVETQLRTLTEWRSEETMVLTLIQVLWVYQVVRDPLFFVLTETSNGLIDMV